MIAARPDTGETLTRLEAAMRQPDLPPSAVERCGRLIARLQRPVGLGLFGLPGAGKAPLLNAIAGGCVIPEGLSLPTLEVEHGPVPRVTVTRADGSEVRHDGPVDREVLTLAPIFLRVEAPLEGLRGRRLLNLVTDTPGEMGPALAWAAGRCDIALWCARDWSSAEREVWRHAPEGLKNHAVLVHSGNGEARMPHGDQVPGFERSFRITPLRLVRASDMTTVRPVAGIDGLLAHVRQVIAAGQAEDLDAAMVLLHRHNRRTGRPDEAPPAPMLAPVPAVAPHDAGRLTPDGRAALSRGFQIVRRCAAGLADALPDGPLPEDRAEILLTGIDAALEALQEVFDSDDTLAEALPDLAGTVVEARELALLMRIEGGAEQAAEAAALLLQTRREIEAALAEPP